MAKRNKQENQSTFEERSKSPEIINDNSSAVSLESVANVQAQEELNEQNIANLSAELAKKYAKKAATKVKDKALGVGEVALKGTAGGLVGTGEGAIKSVKGIWRTAKEVVFGSGGGIIDFLIPEEIRKGFLKGFKMTREVFNENKKDGKKEK